MTLTSVSPATEAGAQRGQRLVEPQPGGGRKISIVRAERQPQAEAAAASRVAIQVGRAWNRVGFPTIRVRGTGRVGGPRTGSVKRVETE